MAAKASSIIAKSRTKDSLQALAKLTTVVDGRRRIISDPPLVVPLTELYEQPEIDRLLESLHGLVRSYRRTLQSDRRHLLEDFELVDVARKVVGVGSVGTRAWILLLQGRDGDDPLFLQAKEAEASVLEAFVGKSKYANHGERVVHRAAPDAGGQRHLLGLATRRGHRRRVAGLLPAPAPRLEGFVRRRGRPAAGRHDLLGGLCSGLGPGPCPLGRPHRHRVVSREQQHLRRSLVEFAQTYADQNERDYGR